MAEVTIVMTTYFPPGPDGEKRRKVAQQALDSWGKFLLGADILLHVADDGTENFQSDFKSSWEISYSSQGRHGVGASLNQGFWLAFKRSPFVLYLVDDWELTTPFDLDPWIRLLEEDESIGVVRFGPPHPHLTGTVVHNDFGWHLRLDRHHYAFSHRPALYHHRMLKAYGKFPEDCNAYDCERLYNEIFCSRQGPNVVYALPYPWQHLESVELAGITP